MISINRDTLLLVAMAQQQYMLLAAIGPEGTEIFKIQLAH